MESSFCSARYYKPLIGFGSYGSQILSLAPHIITAKLTRRILLLESFRGVNSPQRGEEIKYGKRLLNALRAKKGIYFKNIEKTFKK